MTTTKWEDHALHRFKCPRYLGLTTYDTSSQVSYTAVLTLQQENWKMHSYLILCISTTTSMLHQRSLLTMTEMCSRCICSWRTWAGSRAVGCVVWARSSDSVMDTWKYRVPFSNHCCFQCTWEISSPVPDISAKTKEGGYQFIRNI